jgi:hypothetical protein
MAPRSPDFKRNKSMMELIADTRKPKLMPETGWYRIGISELFEGAGQGGLFVGSSLAIFDLYASWRNVDDTPTSGSASASSPASWYLSPDGDVRLRGRVISPEITGEIETLFWLPPEARPEFIERFIVTVDAYGNVDLSGVRFRAWGGGVVVGD